MEWNPRKYENRQNLIMLDYLKNNPDSKINIIKSRKKNQNLYPAIY